MNKCHLIKIYFFYIIISSASCNNSYIKPNTIFILSINRNQTVKFYVNLRERSICQYKVYQLRYRSLSSPVYAFLWHSVRESEARKPVL